MVAKANSLGGAVLGAWTDGKTDFRSASQPTPPPNVHPPRSSGPYDQGLLTIGFP